MEALVFVVPPLFPSGLSALEVPNSIHEFIVNSSLVSSKFERSSRLSANLAWIIAASSLSTYCSINARLRYPVSTERGSGSVASSAINNFSGHNSTQVSP